LCVCVSLPVWWFGVYECVCVCLSVSVCVCVGTNSLLHVCVLTRVYVCM